MSDLRNYIKFYGIYLDDWSTTFGGQTYSRFMLRDWVANAESEPSSTWQLAGRSFLYPHHIKKKYLLEGVIDGEVTFGATAASHVSTFNVTLFKLNADTTQTDLATTGNITTVNRNIGALGALSYHFWIDVFDAKELGEYDRLGVKVVWTSTSGTTANLYHDYDATYGYDLWVDVPFIFGD